MTRTTGEFLLMGARQSAPKATPGLYVVATPIGHLADITLRALETLAGVDLILAEDTRHSRRLLDHYGLSTPMSAYHEHNGERARPEMLGRLERGEALALISDAGTPLLSDPGFKLVAQARRQGSSVIPIPGPSALLAALVAAGMPMDRFLFEGFLPARTEARRTRLNALAALDATLVFYESPQRLADSLADLARELGARSATVARELTKMNETLDTGPLDELAERYAARETRGEIVIVVAPPAERAAIDPDELRREVVSLLGTHGVKDAAAVLAARHGLPRRELYAMALEAARERRT